MGALGNVVVGLDGSAESCAGLRWALAALAETGGLHAVHVVSPAEELARDAVLGDSVKLLRRRERELADLWLRPARGSSVEIRPIVREGVVATVLLDVAEETGADAIVVGHHPQVRLGPQLVGHVTAELLRRSSRPVIIVPSAWAGEGSEAPVVVGVGVGRGTEAAIHWALTRTDVGKAGLSLVHALTHRSLFRPDGVLDLLAFHLDPSVLPTWLEEDLTDLAERIAAEAGLEHVDLSVTVGPGRTGPALVEAGRDAGLLVIGRGEPAFIRRHTIAPFLRHAIVNAPCPIAVVPADGEP